MDKQVESIANSAAKARKEPRATLKWSEALAEAPWDGSRFAAAWEARFREVYATALVKRGFAEERPEPGRPGKSGTPTKLMTRPFRATPEEFEDQDARAGKKGLSWSTWARRKLSEGD